MPGSLAEAADDGMVGVNAVDVVLAHNNVFWGKGTVHKAMLMQVGKTAENLGKHVLNLHYEEEKKKRGFRKTIPAETLWKFFKDLAWGSVSRATLSGCSASRRAFQSRHSRARTSKTKCASHKDGWI